MGKAAELSPERQASLIGVLALILTGIAVPAPLSIARTVVCV